jgi:hypothetical protein
MLPPFYLIGGYFFSFFLSFNTSALIEHKFKSIALNYLLHCLPGNLISKNIVFENIKNYLDNDGIVFGTTILGSELPLLSSSRIVSDYYNFKHVFCNSSDSLRDLHITLSKTFETYSISTKGYVAFFNATSPKK